MGFLKGYTPWIKGRKHTAEAKKKMSEAKKGKRISPSTEFKKGQVTHIPTLEERKKLSERMKLNNPSRDPRVRELNSLAHRGEKSWRWKGGISKLKEYKTFRVKRRRANKTNNGGSHTFAEWETLKAQYDWICPCCKSKEPKIKLSQDHIIPLSKGGSDNIENIQPLCLPCNKKKHTKVIRYSL